MKEKILSFVTLLSLLLSGTAATEPTAPSTDVQALPEGVLTGGPEEVLRQVRDYIRRYLESTPERDERFVNITDMALLIVAESERFRVDPLMTAVVMRYESGYQVRPGLGIRGSAGERGLGQLHGLAFNTARRAGCELTTVKGQVCGAASWLRFCLDLCLEDELAALRAYQGGTCKAKTAGAFLRYRSLLIARGLAEQAAEVRKKQAKLFAER